MRVVFLGPPGAGKGTQAKRIAGEFSIPHISTGDILRAAVQAGTELGLEAKKIMDSGQLVPDSTIVAIIEERISEPDCSSGYILDGFPRTVPQAEALAEMLSSRREGIDAVLLFDVPAAEVLRRMEARRLSEGRSDDSAETQRERLKVYEAQTAPLIEYYNSAGLLRTVSGIGTLEEIQKRLVSELTH
jgi:adenylate kinase